MLWQSFFGKKNTNRCEEFDRMIVRPDMYAHGIRRNFLHHQPTISSTQQYARRKRRMTGKN